MSFDAHANLVAAAVASAPSPALSGTTLDVEAGAGADFPSPPFNCTIEGDTGDPEIVRVTGITDDTLTIVRAQEGTLAREIANGDTIAVTITAKVITDIETEIESNKVPSGTDDPNGVVVGRIGQIYTQVPGNGTATTWINIDGDKAWV